MNSLCTGLMLLCAPLVLATPSCGQSSSPHVQQATARTAESASRVAPVPQQLFGSIALSTRSEDARKFVELSLDKYENGLTEDALVLARHATEKDPQFALGYAVLAFAARRTQPDGSSLARANFLVSKSSPDEQLLVRWMTSVEGHDLLPAIANMNDLLKRFPKDKHVLYLTAEWLYFQQDYDRSRKMMEQVLQLDSSFPPALNMLGYAYIQTGDPDPERAIASLKHYAEVLGTTPNPEDSLGEISRFAGDDRSSLEHYGAALQIDPYFFTSQLGLGDTLTLMGNYQDAREEYDRAIKIAETPRDVFHAKFQRALVYFWEGQTTAGRNSLDALAVEAEKSKEPYAILEIGIGREMLAANYSESLPLLKSLEAYLAKTPQGMSGSDHGVALATVLREEVRLSAQNGQLSGAEQGIAKLEKLAVESRDLLVEGQYESAHGYLLFSQADFESAENDLAADQQSPLALQQLITVQSKLGNRAGVENARNRLKYQRAPTVEWYLVTHKSSAASD